MTIRLSAFVLLACLAAPAGAQQLVELPLGTWIHDVSADGSTVVGSWNGEAFFWKWRSDPAPIGIGGLGATAVSADGTWIAGNLEDPLTGAQMAGRWSVVTGWQPLGGLDECGSITSAYDISDDGDKVVGLAWNNCSGRGFLWSASTGILELMNLGNGNCRASAISADGTQIGGFAQGTFERTPALWDAASTNGFLFDVDSVGEVLGLDGDGSTWVGTRWFGGNSYSAFVGSNATGFVDLGSLNPGWGGNAYDISADGGLIAGFDVFGLARAAWVWRQGSGITSLPDLLTELGFGSTLDFQTCIATSDDGKVVVGGGYGAGFFQGHGYILEIAPQDTPWEDLGGATGSVSGTPALTGAGTLLTGAPTNLDLVGAPSSALSLVWVSVTSVPFPVFGGTLHANPHVSEFLIPLNGSGEFHAAFPWFAGVPSGFELYFQFIVQDPSIFWGFTLSNGLKATAP